MISPTIYAILANRVYNRASLNRGPIPDGWEEIPGFYVPDDGDGFSAGAYRNNLTNEVVIAYTGTNAGTDWTEANFPAAFGQPSDQVDRAIEFYSDVVAEFGATSISFTGHSLGGGLASLMTAYFGEPATVFDAAPFRASALNTATVEGYFERYVEYQTQNNRPTNAAFAHYVDAFDGHTNSDLASRQAAVKSYYIDGEVLEAVRNAGAIVGQSIEIDVGNPSLGVLEPIELHSMALLALSMLSERFRAALEASPGALDALFNGAYTGEGTSGQPQRDFLSDLLRNHVGVDGTANPSGNGILEAFARDVRRTTVTGVADMSPDLRRALVSGVMEYYYEGDFLNQEQGPTEFTENAAGGVHLDFSRTAIEGVGAEDEGREALVESLAANFYRTRVWLGSAATTLGESARNFWIQTTASFNAEGSSMDDVMANVEGSSNLRGGSGNDLMIGGFDGDNLYGDDGEDVLIGGLDRDTLDGGANNDTLDGLDADGGDTLIGGQGLDTYFVDAGDIIRDEDGLGAIYFGATHIPFVEGMLVVGDRTGENTWETTDGELTIQRRQVGVPNEGRYDLIVRNSSNATIITLQQWRQGDLGISLDSATRIRDFTGAAVLNEGFGETYTVNLAGIARAGDRIRLDLSGLSDSVRVVTGAETLSFNAGTLDFALVEGQTTLVFALLSQGDVDEGAQVNLIAQILDAGGNPQGAAANLSINIVAVTEVAPVNSYVGISGHDMTFGLAAATTYVGNGGGDLLLSRADDDVMFASGQVDIATAITNGATGEGASGTAEVSMANGDAFLSSGAGRDILVGSAGADLLAGGAGDDLLVGGQGDDVLASDDELFVSNVNFPNSSDPLTFDWRFVETGTGGSAFSLTGTGAIGMLRAATGADVVHAGGGNDLVYAGAGDDTVYGEDGDDDIYAGAGADTLLGGDGNDSIAGDVDLTPYLNLAQGAADFIDGGAGNDVLLGQSGADVVYGGSNDDTLYGDFTAAGSVYEQYSGNDYLNGEDGNDSLRGEGGADTLIGGMGNDYLYGDESSNSIALQLGDFLDGGTGNDVLVGGGGSDTLLGGVGDDQLYGDASQTPEAAQAGDYLDGGAGNDQLVGGGGADLLFGGDGADLLFGDDTNTPDAIQGDDTLDGGLGNDQMYGAGGNDLLYGGEGNDYIVGDNSTGPQGNDEIHGDAGNDLLFGMDGNDRLYGEVGSDTIIGGGGDDILEGGDGDDYSYFDSSIGLFGDAGNDVLIGGAGKDRLHGGDGNDRLVSGSGGDFLYGEAGDDTYVVSLGAGAAFLVDSQGSNTLIFGEGVQAQDVVVTMSDQRVFIDFSGTDYIETYATHFDTFGSVLFADGTSLSNHEFRQLFQPGNLSSPYINLGTGVASSEVEFVRWNNDLLLTYDGPASDWINTTNFGNRNIFFERGDGTPYGMTSSVQVVALTNWFLGNPSTYVNTFVASDGTQFNFAAATASAASTFVASSDGGILSGTESANTLLGAEGEDLISGAGGDDHLSGGQGRDRLSGGTGNDTYRYAIGDGADVILDENGASDVLDFATGIAVGDLTITERADGLHIQVGPSFNGDEITIANWSSGGGKSIDRFTFNGSGALDRNDIDLLNVQNHSPRVLENIGRRRAPLGQAFSFTIPLTAIRDADVGDSLTYQVGALSPLPSWLSFDAGTRTFSGTPTAGNEGLISVDILATDSGGLSTTATFQVDVPSVYSGTLSGDYLTAEGENSAVIYGLDGDDYLAGGVGNDELYGGSGLDELRGAEGNDYLEGGAGNDSLEGGAGSDIFLPGTGADFVNTYEWGGEGSDTVRFFIGDGTDEMILDYIGDTDVVEFGPGISAQYVLENAYFTADGYWVIRYNPINVSDRIQIRNYGAWSGDSANPQDIRTIGTTLRFEGGAEFTLADVFDDMNVLTTGDDFFVATGSAHIDALSGNDWIYVEGSTGLSIDGNAGNDTLDGGASTVGVILNGGAGSDHLIGTKFVDHLIGGDGDDVLDSFGGEDILEGGNGNDVYTRDQFYGAPGGVLTVTDTGGWDTLESGLRMSQSTFSRVGDDLSISQTISGATSTLVVEDWYVSTDRRIERMEFTTGVSYSNYFYTADQIDGLVAGTNTAPTVNIRMEDVGATIGLNFSQFYSADNAIDSQTSYGSLTRTVRLADGSPLPAWLTYAGQTFSGTPGAADAGELRIVIESTDSGGLSVADEFTIVVGSGLVFGNNNNNTYNGSSSANIYFGRNGNDTLNGNGGNDQLYGGLGNDTISGGDGDDILVGGPGADTLTGGIGTNIYRLDPYDSADTHAMSTTGTHRFQFGAGIASADISVEMIAATDGSVGMRIRYYEDAASDVLQLNSVFAFGGNDLQLNSNAGAYTFEFRDGSQFTVSQLVDLASSSASPTAGDDFLMLTSAATVDGGDGADVIVGSSFADQLSGGTGQDRLYGMAGIDTLYGGDGNDVLSGGAGTDAAAGGLGDDLYIVESFSDISTEAFGEGIDSVESSATYTLGNNIENLTLTGSAANNATGNTLSNTLIGNSGANILDGGTGADVFVGGAGNDTYVVDDTGDVITENAGAGTDAVQASASYVLSANVENLTLTGTANINATGNAAANNLTGNSGDNVLDGSAGNDTLAGGLGNDTYVVDSTSDVVTEAASAGTDLVQSAVTYTIGANVENLTLTGAGSINGTGNAVANIITGNSANNTLNGLTGADTFLGGAGNDTYVVDDASDVVIENASEGTDLVQSSVTHTLGGNIENLTLTGTSAISGSGNALVNTLAGNSGNNVLDGGAGADTLVGGAGNDTYVVDNTGDVVTEGASAGTDLIQSSVSYILGSNVENLTMTGTAAINGTGNTLNNVLTGNVGNNTLDAGSAGTDTLTGGLGNDTYVVARTTGITINESVNEGTDTVQSSVTYALAANVENLTLTGNSAINGTGNTVNNMLTGNSGNNTLTGAAGNDTLIGGNGADIYSYSSGHGADVIDNSSTDTAQDRLNVTNLTRSQVTFSRSGDNLLMARNGSATDSVVVTNWFTITSNQLEFVQFTDQTLTNTQINSLLGFSGLASRTLAATSQLGVSDGALEIYAEVAVAAGEDIDLLFPVKTGVEDRAESVGQWMAARRNQMITMDHERVRDVPSMCRVVLDGTVHSHIDRWARVSELLAEHINRTAGGVAGIDTVENDAAIWRGLGTSLVSDPAGIHRGTHAHTSLRPETGSRNMDLR